MILLEGFLVRLMIGIIKHPSRRIINAIWITKRMGLYSEELGLLVMFFGSCTLFGLGLLGEYIGKILEESKLRPRFIRNKIIMRGSETSE